MVSFREIGQGRPLLLMHGGGEDAGMLAPQAAAFAARGRRVIWYDRRGTGASPRDGWPERGVAGHAEARQRGCGSGWRAGHQSHELLQCAEAGP